MNEDEPMNGAMKKQVEPDSSEPQLFMRLMCSQDQAKVESVRTELLKAGINVEVRNHPLAERLGVRGVELWVPQERDYLEASKLYARFQDRAPRASGNPVTDSPAAALEPNPEADEPNAERNGAPPSDADAAVPKLTREQLKQAGSLLEQGIDELCRRESEFAEECASLRSKVDELSQALDHALSALANETEARASIEKIQAEQISGLVSALENERQEWQQKNQALEKQLAEHKDLEQQMEAHVLSLSSLCGRREFPVLGSAQS